MFERALTGRSHLEPKLAANDGTPGEFGGLPGDREPTPLTSSLNPAQPRLPCQVVTRARVGHLERIRGPQEEFRTREQPSESKPELCLAFNTISAFF